MQTVSVKESLKFGWETFKKRPWLSMGVVAFMIILSAILSALTDSNARDVFSIIVTIAIFVVNVLMEMGLISFALKAHSDIESASFKDLWHPHSLWQYIVVKILTGLIVVVGLILLIVPGIIAALSLLFATYLVIDRARGPIEAIKESIALTKGHRWNLFLFSLSLMALNILGVLAFFVGLLITIPVSLFAVAHVYRTLSTNA